MSLLELKIEFHSHTNSDPIDAIAYTAHDLVDQAALQGFDALAITCHDALQFSEELRAYAAAAGILLIPGVEATIEGKHVLVYGLEQFREPMTFAELRQVRSSDPNILTIAPHPYFPSGTCLGNKLAEHLDCFDALEYSHFYTRKINFNREAVRFAKHHDKALVGTSDVHLLAHQLGKTYAIVSASEKSYPAIVASIRAGQVQLETQPLKPLQLARLFIGMARVGLTGRLRRRGLLLGPSRLAWPPNRS